MMAAVSVAPVLDQTKWTSAREALAEIVAGRDELEQFLTEVYGHLETLWNRLEERQRAMASAGQRLGEESRKRAEELDRQWAALGDRKKRARQQVQRGVAAATAEFAEAMAHQRLQMAEERAKWHDELKQVRQLLERIAHRQAKSSTT